MVTSEKHWRFFKRKCRGIDLNGGNGVNQHVSEQKDRKMEINLSILITSNRIEGQPNDRSLRVCAGFGCMVLIIWCMLRAKALEEGRINYKWL